jgi:alpha-tubulin suppressor-like RCC1 family protein
VYTWGSNVRKSLGINDTNVGSAYFTPVNVQSSNWVVSSVACGDETTILFSNSSVRGFGNVAYLGASSTSTSFIIPQNISAVTPGNYSKVFAAGQAVFYILPSGDVYAAGENGLGQLGQSGGTSRNYLAAIPGLVGQNVKKVAGSTTMTCALDAAGNIWVSGTNYNGELGLNVTNPLQPVATITKHPYFVSNSLNIVNMWSSYFSTFALTNGGVLYAFGNNTSGQLGFDSGNATWVISPAIVPTGALSGTIVDIQIGHSHTLLLTSTGAVFCTGNNTLGSCGTDTWQQQYNTFTAVLGVPGASSILVQDKTSFAVVSGTLFAWGDVVKQGCGVRYNVPVQILGSTAFQKVYCGDQVSYGLTPYTSTLWGWGKNVAYQVTNTDRMDRHSPWFVPHTAAWNFTDVAVSGFDPTYTVMGLRDAQYRPLVGWGRNDYGQLGTDVNPATPDSFDAAAPIITTGVNITTFRVTLGNTHTVVVGAYTPSTTPIGIHVFGNNDVGQIGQGLGGANAKRLQLTDGIVDACAGSYHTVWIGSGLLSVTGRNNWGQIGMGVVGQIAQPEQKNLTTAALTSVFCGARSTFVVAADGIYVAGDDTSGALGLGTASIVNIFTKHTFANFLSEGVLKIHGGVGESSHTLVLTKIGNVYAMGDNSYGQLGLSNFITVTTPTLVVPGGVPSDYRALDVCVGTDHALAVWGKRSCPGDCKGGSTDPKGTCDTVLGTCNCYTGFTGASCQLFQCTDPICSGYGTCDQTKGLCVCQTNFEGDKCQFRKCPNACSGRGSCDRGTGICNCEAGYVGIDCSTNGASVGVVSFLVIIIAAILLL